MEAKKYFDKEYGDNHIKGVVDLKDLESLYGLMQEYADEQLRLHIVSQQSERLPDAYKTELLNVKQLGQTQTSLNEQLQILRTFANKLGLYDAADYLNLNKEQWKKINL